MDEKPTSTSHIDFNSSTATKDSSVQNFQEPRVSNNTEIGKSTSAQDKHSKFPKISVSRDLSLAKNINEHYLSRKDHSNLKKKLSIQEYNSRKRKMVESNSSTPEKVPKIVQVEKTSTVCSEEKKQIKPSTIYAGMQLETFSNCVRDPRRLLSMNSKHPELLRCNSEVNIFRIPDHVL